MDYTAMGKQFELLNDFTDAYHWDVMDGNYVPNVSLNFEMLETLGHVIRSHSGPPNGSRGLCGAPY